MMNSMVARSIKNQFQRTKVINDLFKTKATFIHISMDKYVRIFTLNFNVGQEIFQVSRLTSESEKVSLRF